MVGATPEISVVVPTFNRPDRCRRVLQALAAQTLDPDRFEVLAVDDCSTDDTNAVLAGLVNEVPYALRPRRTATNGGPAAARNLGWRQAQAPLIAFLDDDCTPEPGWLEAALRYLTDHPAIGVAQGCTKAPDGVDVATLQGLYVWRVIQQATPYFDACNIFYRQAALTSTGGFDEAIAWWPSYGAPGATPVAWGEDSAAGWAVVEAGWERGFVADAVAAHDVELRNLRWHLKHAYLDHVILGLGVAHPGYRREAFWRPWAYRREDAAFLAAVAGVVAALRWRPAALAALPYLWWRRPSVRRPGFVLLFAQSIAIDTARAAGQAAGAVKHRTFVL